MSRVLVSYFSFSGKTRQLAEAAAEGARSAGAEAVVKEVAATNVDDLLTADAFIVATPQSFGTMAGETKKMFERLWMGRDRIEAKPVFAAIVTHATEPAATVDLMKKFGGYFGYGKAADSLTIPVADLEAGKERARQLGASLATAQKSS
jgi:NAD(P)H dehydrogenase (quinone)